MSIDTGIYADAIVVYIIVDVFVFAAGSDLHKVDSCEEENAEAKWLEEAGEVVKVSETSLSRPQLWELRLCFMARQVRHLPLPLEQNVGQYSLVPDVIDEHLSVYNMLLRDKRVVDIRHIIGIRRKYVL